jgi:tRNA(fMet)-specific endonuclease VapC
MIERLAVDTNAVIEWLRTANAEPLALRTARRIALLLPVVGELYTGVFASTHREANMTVVEELIARADVIKPDEQTARLYGSIRAQMQLTDIRASKMNDLWIAALCLQHALPLLTNDRGFDTIDGLAVIHW